MPKVEESKSLLVIEPHPDDAWLSLGGHLKSLWDDYDVTILTVFSNDRRKVEAENYAKSIGAESIVMGLEETDMLEKTGPSSIPGLRKILKRFKRAQKVFPVGLQHPDHFSVASYASNSDWLYLDTPYQSKQKLGEELRESLCGLPIVSILFPHANKWKAEEIFKSQAKFMHYNADLKGSKLPELILEKMET